MIFTIGTKVIFKNTGDEGIIVKVLDNGMLSVYIEDENMAIPVAIEDVVRAGTDTANRSDNHGKLIKIKKEPAPIAKQPEPEPERQYTILNSYGLQMAFDPILSGDATAEEFEVFLLNDTRHEVLYSIDFTLKGKKEDHYNGKLKGMSIISLGFLDYAELNDNPGWKVDCWRVTTEGSGSKLSKTLKIKPKQFFAKIKTAPLLNRQAHLYTLFEDITASKTLTQHPSPDTLKDYTRRNIQAKDSRVKQEQFRKVSIDLEEVIHFMNEIDLHIEELVPVHRKMTSLEKLKIQLKALDEYIDQAVRIGVDRVFVIHGVGKGMLKSKVADRLAKNSDVKSFRNEYHPNYGWGATEVIFKSDESSPASK